MKEIFKKIITRIIEVEASLILRKYKPKIIAITGSVGKTSTKDAIYAVFSKFYYVRKSQKSFNSEIGLPLTILGCENGWSNPVIWIKNILKGLSLILWKQDYPKWLVLEIGAGEPGDIERATKLIKADVVVMTRFPDIPVHIEFFKSAEHIIEEKTKLLKALKPDGLLVLNADDQKVLDLKNKTENRVVTFGFSENANLKASNEQIIYITEKDKTSKPSGMVFRINYTGNSIPVIIGNIFGKTHIYASLAALAIALEKDLNMVQSAESLKHYETPPGRMKLIEGIKDSLLIDDTYNSSPAACEAAIETLDLIKSSGKKIAVLGDMLELGKFTEEAHKGIGMLVSSVAKILITIGPRSKFIAEGALTKGMSEKNIFQFEEAQKAGKFLESIIEKGDVVLIKGSQGVRMERTVEEVMAHPEDKVNLLVRQDMEWGKR